jgi:WD40 repeat protein
MQQVSAIPELGLVSSSRDASVRVADIERRQVIRTVTCHSKAVFCFAHCRAYSLVASGGLDRSVLLWQASGGRPIGELRGHSAPVTHLALDNGQCQVGSPKTPFLTHVIVLGVFSWMRGSADVE